MISFIIGLYFVISDVLITIIVSFMLAICIFGFLSLTDSSKIIDSGKEAINKIIPKRRLPILNQISIGVNVIPIWIICFILVYLAYVLLGKQLDLGLEAIAEIGIALLVPIMLTMQIWAASVIGIAAMLCKVIDGSEILKSEYQELDNYLIAALLLIYAIGIALIIHKVLIKHKSIAEREDLFSDFPSDELYRQTDAGLINRLELYLNDYLSNKLPIMKLEYACLEKCELERWYSSAKTIMNRIMGIVALLTIPKIVTSYIHKDIKTIVLVVISAVVYVLLILKRTYRNNWFKLVAIRLVYGSKGFYLVGKRETVVGEVQLYDKTGYHKKVYALLNIIALLRCMMIKDEIDHSDRLIAAMHSIQRYQVNLHEFGDCLPELIVGFMYYMNKGKLPPKLFESNGSSVIINRREFMIFLQSLWTYLTKNPVETGGGKLACNMVEALIANTEENSKQKEELKMIKYIILDVDGTLTDGGIYYDDNNNELKKFCTKDGTGIIVARAAGIKILIITGRECKATTRRLTELGITDIYQNVKDKVSFLDQWIADNNIDKREIAYIGDDVNDLGAMKLCGYIGCPSDSPVEVKELATYVSPIQGGYGAARDIIEHYLREQGTWSDLVNKAYGAGT